MKNYFEISKGPDADSMTGPATEQASQFFQRGLGLKKEVREILKRDYHSKVVAYLRENGNTLKTSSFTLFLAHEFGFCYGVDRAVDYAYQTREKFPERRLFLTGEIIHNPHVNNRLIEMGVQFLSGQYSNGTTIADLRPDDVVILPAFGVSIHEFKALKDRKCVLVDTTCGSVLNVWKRVSFYAKNGYTSIIHGKYYHEETIATSSQALRFKDGKYLIVRNMEEAQQVCDFILNGGNHDAFMTRFEKCVSPGFDPDKDLERVGLANQTTMLSSESLAIAEEFKKAMIAKYGKEASDEHFQTFDTICSATQDRQDAVMELVKRQRLDLMVVIGGFNSSNTNHLAEITSKYTRTFHIDDPSCLLNPEEIRHKKVGSQDIVVDSGWLPEGNINIGMTAGASTPNNRIGQAIERIASLRGIELGEIISGD